MCILKNWSAKNCRGSEAHIDVCLWNTECLHPEDRLSNNTYIVLNILLSVPRVDAPFQDSVSFSLTHSLSRSLSRCTMNHKYTTVVEGETKQRNRGYVGARESQTQTAATVGNNLPIGIETGLFRDDWLIELSGFSRDEWITSVTFQSLASLLVVYWCE